MRALLIAAVALATLSPQLGHADPAASNDGLDTPQSKLSDARIAAAHHAFDVVNARWKSGGGRIDDVYLWSRRILEAELDREPIARRDSDQSYRDNETRMQSLDTAAVTLHGKGVVSDVDLAAADYYRAEAVFLFENNRIE
jgi:hypothetical protein